jgi:dihydroorotate dehydrogenase (NAD+) catalytic subunit
MSNLEISIGSMKFANPVFCSSGCFGNAYEIAPHTDIPRIGAVSLKTFTLEPRKGNRPPRIHEVHAGMLSSIGLQNPGLEVYMGSIFPKAQRVCRPDQIFLSLAGNTIEDYEMLTARIAELITTDDIAALEINTACPTVKFGGGSYSKMPDELYKLVLAVMKISPFPVICKINTNYDNTCDAAKAVEAAGAAAIYTTSTPLGMAINTKTRRPVLGNVKGPISGPAVRPIGISKIWDMYNAVRLPIIASGGIACANDALEYMMAGASAVGIGSAHFMDPRASVSIIDGLDTFFAENGITSVNDIIGVAHNF